MQSNVARIAVLAAVIAAAVLLFVVFSGGDDDGDGNGGASEATVSTGATTVASEPDVIRVKGGEPVGGVQTLTYDKGDRVRIEVDLDQPQEEIHVHGYEITQPAEKSPVRLSFKADIDGLFEIEVHGAEGDTQVAELRVNP